MITHGAPGLSGRIPTPAVTANDIPSHRAPPHVHFVFSFTVPLGDSNVMPLTNSGNVSDRSLLPSNSAKMRSTNRDDLPR